MVLPFLPGMIPPAPQPVIPGADLLPPLPLPMLIPGLDEPPEEEREPRRHKPKPDEIRQIAEQVVSFWSARDRRMDEDLALYRLAKTYTGEGELILRNTVAVVVDKAAALIGRQRASIDVIPPRLDLREQAQRVEDFLRYTWRTWDRRWADVLGNGLQRDLAFFLLQRGWLTALVSYDADAEGNELPVRFTPVDPRQVYPVVGSRGIRAVIRRYYTTIAGLLEDFPRAEKYFGNRQLTDQVQVTEYWDDWYHYAYAEGIELKPVTAHEYGVIPWVIQTGMGEPLRSTIGDQNGWVSEVGVSVYHKIKDSYKQLNKVLSQFATHVAEAANPALLYYTVPAQGGEPKEILRGRGAINELDVSSGERVEFLMPPVPHPMMAQPLVEALRDDIAKGSLPDVLWGAGGASGFALSLMGEAAQDTLYPIVHALELAMAKANTLALELIRRFHDGEIGFFVRDRQTGAYVGGVTISPDLIEEVGTENIVTFRDIAPRDLVALSNLAVMLTKENLISLERAREEYLRLENPERENELIISELVYRDQELMREFMLPMVLSKTRPELLPFYFLARMREQAREQQQQQAPQAPGQPPVPGLPPNVLPPQIAQMLPQQMVQHSAASAAGGMGVVAPPGVPGAGAMPVPPPLIPGLSRPVMR